MYSSSFPFISHLPPRITLKICKNTLLISCQKWQPPPMTSAPCIQFFPLFIFIFHFLHCTWDKYSFTAPPLCTRPSSLPPTWPQWHVTQYIGYWQSQMQTWTQCNSLSTVLWIYRKAANIYKNKYKNTPELLQSNAIRHWISLRLNVGHLACRWQSSLSLCSSFQS